MKTKLISRQQGSVLMTAVLTITILTMICATSLYIASQNGNATTQTTSWQQALTGAEAAVDQALNALNTNSWSGWYTITNGTLPQTQPTPSGIPNATGTPGTGKYNYLGPSTSPGSTPLYAPISLNGEASNSITWWVTVDDGSVGPTPSPSPGLILNGKQAYRIRATAVVAAPGPGRVSNQKLDNDLRKISLRFDRLGGGAISTPQAVRRIEVITTPVSPGLFSLGMEVGSALQFSGGSSTVDSFKSSLVPGNHQWSLPYRRSNAALAIVNNSNSDLRSTTVYGGLTYSSSTNTAPKNTSNVGSVQSPFGGSISPAPTPPTGVTYTTYTGGGSNPPNSGQFTVLTNGGTAYIKVNGDLVVSSSGSPLHLVQHDSSNPEQMIIWVTGQLKTQGSGYIQQDSNIAVKYYVGGDITVSGSSYQNNTGYAADLVIYGMGGSGSKVTVSSGTAMFTGAIDAPNYDVTISGGADFSGAVIAQSVTLSGGSSFHYDEDLNTASAGGGGNYAFSSWFEDNSDPARGIIY
jgi:hypothetical protein